MSSKDTKIIKFNKHHKYDKEAAIFLEIMTFCLKNYIDATVIRKLSTTKIAKHTTSTFSISTIFSFKSTKNMLKIG